MTALAAIADAGSHIDTSLPDVIAGCLLALAAATAARYAARYARRRRNR